MAVNATPTDDETNWPSIPDGLVGDDLARALVRRGVKRAAAQVDGRCRRGGFREGAHTRPPAGPSYERRTTRVVLPPDRDVKFRGHVRGAMEMMVELGVLDSTDEVVILAMLSLSNEVGLLAWANQHKIGRRAHVSDRTVRSVLPKLRALGLVDWSHEFRNGRHYPNRYVFYLPEHWTRRRVLAAKKRVGPEPDGKVEYAEWCVAVADEVMNPTRARRPRPPASKVGAGRVTPQPASERAAQPPPVQSQPDVVDEHTQCAKHWADRASAADWLAVLGGEVESWLQSSVERRGSASQALVVEAAATRLRAGQQIPGPSP
jgi:hypothetical protein